jgi:hypothetical protein
MVTIYQFEVYRIDSDEFLRSRRWGTREAITDIAHGRVLEGTAIEVDESVIGSDIHGFTVRDFNPHRRSGLQTKVER